MGWYTSGPSDMEFKYGDAHALAQACKLGSLSIAPRLKILLEDGEEFFDLEFLSDFQHEIEKINLPWTHLNFKEDFLQISLSESKIELLNKIQLQVHLHLNSIATLMLKFGVDPNNSIQSITASYDVHWELDKKDWNSLLAWIKSSTSEPLTLEDLNRGSFESEYFLPEDKHVLYQSLTEIQQLALAALGTAVVKNDEVYLYQPDDDTEMEIFSIE